MSPRGPAHPSGRRNGAALISFCKILVIPPRPLPSLIRSRRSPDGCALSLIFNPTLYQGPDRPLRGLHRPLYTLGPTIFGGFCQANFVKYRNLKGIKHCTWSLISSSPASPTPFFLSRHGLRSSSRSQCPRCLGVRISPPSSRCAQRSSSLLHHRLFDF